MALNAYLSIVAERHGPIQGSVVQKGREGKILVIGAMHGIVCPRDPASGIPTGKRMHKPFTILKELDRATPFLFSILCNNEHISSAEIQFWQPSPTGVERQHYTVRLSNANISSIHFKMPNTRYPKLARLTEYEEVAFTYQRIEWVWNDGNLTGVDDWDTPR
jgi:type VI secretion system secreted protein Hcp